MSRAWAWAQLAIAWLPMWALFTAVIMIVHGNAIGDAALASARMIGPGAALALVIYKLLARLPWPHPFRLRFVATHIVAALAYATIWYALICLIDSIILGHITFMIGPGFVTFLFAGIWLYFIVAAVAYANFAAQRTAQMQAHAARMQLDTLRAQLHPHFLFNALHAVVQLIPSDPRGATRAAEQLAAALRTMLEERRDLISLAEECVFVERYLAIERIRFGDRLDVRAHIEESARAALLPSFALQTLVENAVRHGAAPRIEPTCVTISATLIGSALSIKVVDDGDGADVGAIEHSAGTGLRRLQERLRWLYGDRARLDVVSAAGGGFAAELSVPHGGDDVADSVQRA